jgi:[ribosomal protein S18]-alanine N-acetyltransferase
MSALPQPLSADLPFRVRLLRQTDLDAVVSIERDIYPFPWSRGNFLDSLAAGYDAWIFEQSSGLIGYAIVMWSIDEVHLLNLSVCRSAQGQRWGAKLLEWLLLELRGRQARQIYLEVRPSNPVARRLYARAGFEQIGVRKGYYPAPGADREDALVLSRRLSP